MNVEKCKEKKNKNKNEKWKTQKTTTIQYGAKNKRDAGTHTERTNKRQATDHTNQPKRKMSGFYVRIERFLRPYKIMPNRYRSECGILDFGVTGVGILFF